MSHPTPVRTQNYFILKGEGIQLVVANFFFLATMHVSQVTIFLLISNKSCYSLFCNFVSLYERTSVLLLTVISLRMAYPVYFRLQQNSQLYQKQQDTKVTAKEIDTKWSQICFSLLTPSNYFPQSYRLRKLMTLPSQLLQVTLSPQSFPQNSRILHLFSLLCSIYYCLILCY